MPPNLALFIIVVLLVVGWFAVGTQTNVRKGNAALLWLQEGLPQMGEKTSLRWLGSSAVELKIQQAQPPFRSAELVLVLEPRDVPPLWALSRLRGRRDLFIFRATLRSQPSAEVEAFHPRAWSTQGLERRCEEKRWTRLDAPGPLVVYAPTRDESVAALFHAADLPGCPLVRLSVRPSQPNVEVQWHLAHIRRHSSPSVIEALRRIAGCV